MRLVFAGTPAFAVAALEALHAAGHDVARVLTQPDRPAGRGRKLQESAVAHRATELNLPVAKPERLDAAAQAQLRDLAPEAMVVVAYGLILPQAVLDIPRHGCLNIHASLLPRWRGAAPIQRAILAGDPATGITIMRMDAGLDTGPVLLQERIAIPPEATAGDVQDLLAPLGAQLIVAALGRLATGTLVSTPQPLADATYAHKLSKEQARLDWSAPADQLARAVRAFNPAPVAWSELDGDRVRIWRAVPAQASAGSGAPGAVLGASENGIQVAAGRGCLRIQELQWPGGRRVTAAEALRRKQWSGLRFQ